MRSVGHITAPLLRSSGTMEGSKEREEMVQSMPQIHHEPHPLAGETVTIKPGTIDPAQGEVIEGAQYKIEDWWDKLSGKSWMWSNGNPDAIQYAIRAVYNNLPFDDEVVYGKIGILGHHLVHVSEIQQ